MTGMGGLSMTEDEIADVIRLTIEARRGYWEDMGLYWAWRLKRDGELRHPPPTVKKLDYLILGTTKICVGVWDDDKYTPVNREEAERLARHDNK